ncbi:ABC transporter ATP-binding protein [Azohydromonas caseinilytica]|uniref:ABC transporter ATP-binding protein n=1 Tax=Azohydromonas caseinilytica TaxID=2728836 RepID=A0A848FKE8_9BURK|nr:ABC transporter ATP-binding protein [Azohydromonas caseinilytica]NML18730.1 ABC transporter ATP-binding protein [Azohydromonas caseinilytica]
MAARGLYRAAAWPAVQTEAGNGPDARGLRVLRGWMQPLLWRERWKLLAVLALSLLAVAAGLAQPLLTKALIDEGVLARDAGAIVRSGAAMVALALAALGIGLACRRLHVLASMRILHGLKEALFAHLLALSPAFHAQARQGDLMARLEGDLGEVQRFAIDSMLTALNAVLTLVGTVLVLGLLNGELMLMLAVLVALNALLSALIRPRLEALSRRARQAGVEVSSFLVERLGAVKHIQAHVAEAREGEQLAALHAALRRESLRLQLLGQLGGGLPTLLVSLGVIGIFVAGSLAMLRGEAVTLGLLVAFASCVQRASAPVQTLTGLVLAWQRAKVAMERITDLTARQPDVAPRPGGAGLDGLRGEIELRDLRFTWPGSARPALEALSCRIPAGSRVLLRGPSGCGKSTLVDLLHRHFDPDQGRVLLDGTDLRTLDRDALRRRVAVVAQEAALFGGTLEANLRYGRPEATREAVERAAEAAGVTEFLPQLPQGLDSVVGPRGATLSGGQRQRVALARALLMNPAVLVIDEGTSALDEALELRTLRRIGALLPGCTRIVVSHRSTHEGEFDQVIELPGPAVEQRS